MLSVAYQWGGYTRHSENEYEKVKAENDWTAQQVAMYPDRLVAAERQELLVRRMRQIGFDRLLYGSDGAVPGHGPREYWASLRMLPLTPDERCTLATNVAPYLR